MLSSYYLRSLSVRSCHFDGISAFDQFISEIFVFSYFFSVFITILGQFMPDQ